MKLIEPKVEIIPQGEGLLGVYKQIEVAGRTCYKSEDKISTDSSKEFVQRMINSGHTAMLEHGTVYLCREGYWSLFYTDNPYSKVTQDSDGNHCVTTNLRVLQENNCMSDLQYICSPTEYHQKRVTVRFTCDRGIMAELTRHRAFSFAIESTRYCNYSKDKFGNELTFIIPSWINYTEEEANVLLPLVKNGAEIKEEALPIVMFENGLSIIEDVYLYLIAHGWKAQQARQILPNALKTEVVMTGFIEDWKHFFRLRCAPNAHPDMQVLANKLKDLFENNGYI